MTDPIDRSQLTRAYALAGGRPEMLDPAYLRKRAELPGITPGQGPLVARQASPLEADGGPLANMQSIQRAYELSGGDVSKLPPTVREEAPQPAHAPAPEQRREQRAPAGPSTLDAVGGLAAERGASAESAHDAKVGVLLDKSIVASNEIATARERADASHKESLRYRKEAAQAFDELKAHGKAPARTGMEKVMGIIGGVLAAGGNGGAGQAAAMISGMFGRDMEGWAAEQATRSERWKMATQGVSAAEGSESHDLQVAQNIIGLEASDADLTLKAIEEQRLSKDALTLVKETRLKLQEEAIQRMAALRAQASAGRMAEIKRLQAAEDRSLKNEGTRLDNDKKRADLEGGGLDVELPAGYVAPEGLRLDDKAKEAVRKVISASNQAKALTAQARAIMADPTMSTGEKQGSLDQLSSPIASAHSVMQEQGAASQDQIKAARIELARWLHPGSWSGASAGQAIDAIDGITDSIVTGSLSTYRIRPPQRRVATDLAVNGQAAPQRPVRPQVPDFQFGAAPKPTRPPAEPEFQF